MASDFIGFTILVTLRNPPSAQIQGVVSDVVNQRLFLHDVLFLWNGQRLATYALDATAIADLEVSPSQPGRTDDEDTLHTPVAISAPARAMATYAPIPQPPPAAPPAFVDPAILSFSKPPTRSLTLNSTHAPKPSQAHAGPVSPIMIADGAVSHPSPAWTKNGKTGGSSVSSIATAVPRRPGKAHNPASATLTEPFDAHGLEGQVTGESKANANVAQKPADRKLREGAAPSQTGPGIIDMKDMHPVPPKNTTATTNTTSTVTSTPVNNNKHGKGKGWRQTPLIEELPRHPKGNKKKPRGRKAAEEFNNGWATEDATDIQEQGDFDFELNLGKFDKRRVFDDIRREDATADSDRLVSFNRKVRPGTNGGRNLHFTENVLDPPTAPADRDDRWKSEAGETEEDRQEGQYSSGRGSKRAGSRRPIASRKASVIPSHLDRMESPRPVSRVHTASPLNGSVSGLRASFKLPNSNNKPCHCLSPLQMLEIEQLCTSELGLTEDMLTENAGRSIAMAVLRIPDVHSVAFLVGNHKSGARAIAAARHLRNRRLRVTVIVLGGEREELLLEVVRKQLSIYTKGQGYVDRWDQYHSKNANGGPPPDVIVDAMLGIHSTFEELRTDDQATVLEMTRWANRASNIVSIDVPSGLSATSGLLTEVDGQVIAIQSKYVVALGAPKTGLLHAMAVDGVEASWVVLVADIGISASAWQKHGSRRKHGIDFGGEWIVEVKASVSAAA